MIDVDANTVGTNLQTSLYFAILYMCAPVHPGACELARTSAHACVCARLPARVRLPERVHDVAVRAPSSVRADA